MEHKTNISPRKKISVKEKMNGELDRGVKSFLFERLSLAENYDDPFAFDKLVLPYSGKQTRWVKLF
jgi:hypothetical protein